MRNLDFSGFVAYCTTKLTQYYTVPLKENSDFYLKFKIFRLLLKISVDENNTNESID